jgi:putative FmdB family regulatory protein
MPIYEYQCQLCGHAHEALQKMSDDLLVDCPECNKPGLKKKISAAGFRLKGSGWYETDFKNSGKKPKEAKEPKQSKESKTSKDSKSGASSGSSS